MANTYTLIEAKTLSSSSSASITFSSIPQTYTDLLLKISAKSTATRTASGANIEFNGSSSNFSGIRVYADGSTTGAYSSGNFAVAVVGTQTAANNTFCNGDIYITNYTNGNYKSYYADNVTENSAADAIQDFVAGLWSNTAAITSITIKTDTPGSEYLASGSTFYLYGIKNS
jgi:hypothetical protein